MFHFNGESELRMAMRHVQEGRACIARQRKLIAKLRERGLLTKSAEEVLSWMDRMQSAFEADYDAIRRKVLVSLDPTGLLPPRKRSDSPALNPGLRLRDGNEARAGAGVQSHMNFRGPYFGKGEILFQACKLLGPNLTKTFRDYNLDKSVSIGRMANIGAIQCLLNFKIHALPMKL